MSAENWVGGDIAGLHAMAQSLDAAPGEMQDVVTALSSKVQALIGDVGWKGDTASQFAQKWSADSVTAGALAEATKAIGDALGELASTLDAIDNALYNAAHEASAQGVPIGPDGKPPTIATSANPSPEESKALTALQGYTEDYNQAMDEAKAARVVAEEKLNDIYNTIGPENQGAAKTTSSQALTVGGYIKSLYAIPASRTRDILKDGPERLAAAQQAMKDARPAYQAAKQEYAAKGLKLTKDNPARVTHNEAANELNEIRGQLDAAEKGEFTNPMSKAFDTRISDLGEIASTTGRLPKFLDFAEKIPAIGVVATGVGAEIDSRSDMEKGDSPERAREVNYGAGFGGLAAGIGTAAAIAAAPVDVPVAAVVSASTVVGVGAGDLIKEGLDEHWSEDIHNHGLIGGIGTGIKNMGVNTGKDFSNLAAGIWHAVTG